MGGSSEIAWCYCKKLVWLERRTSDPLFTRAVHKCPWAWSRWLEKTQAITFPGALTQPAPELCPRLPFCDLGPNHVTSHQQALTLNLWVSMQGPLWARMLSLLTFTSCTNAVWPINNTVKAFTAFQIKFSKGTFEMTKLCFKAMCPSRHEKGNCCLTRVPEGGEPFPPSRGMDLKR